MRKRILCFGDSNTWGYVSTGGRFDEDTRWPMVMARLLGDGYMVVEEGFNGRTCVLDDPAEGGFKSGLNYLPPCLMSHNPLDAVIIMLGTNDTKRRFNMTAGTIARSLSYLVQAVQIYGETAAGQTPRIIVTAPPYILDNLMDTDFGDCFGPQSIAVSHGLGEAYRRVAEEMNVDFFDAAPVAEVSPVDAVHLTANGHLRLAEAMAEKIKTVL